MSTITVADLQLNVLQEGQGPDVVLIHGLGANMAFWYPHIMMPLAKSFRVTAYDLRGHGNSSMPVSGYDTLAMSGDLVTVFDKCGISQAHLVGHSYGGGIALHFALLHPERVLSLTLADAMVNALQPVVKLCDWPYWNDVLRDKFHQEGISLPSENIELNADLLEKLADPRWAQARNNLRKQGVYLPFGSWNKGKKSAKRFQHLLKHTTVGSQTKEVAGLTRESIEKINMAGLVIYGEYSMYLATMRALTELLPSCQKVIVPQVAHFHPVIKPFFFLNALFDFFPSDKVTEIVTIQ
ncbi:MAG: alpha/beta hydrolase [Pseudomonadota bacterium]|nr:alpha/beta hydrolase [Pseudomonadota bacterium]